MNVTSYITKEYENISNWAICENEPKTNQKQTQSNPIFSRTKPTTIAGLSYVTELAVVVIRAAVLYDVPFIGVKVPVS